MNKKRILVVNYNMIVGGSTTSLISFLNNIDTNKYDVDLLLYKNEGPLLEMLPSNINILKPAFKYKGIVGRVLKYFLCVFSGYLIRAKKVNMRLGLPGCSSQIMSDFQALYLSRKIEKQYDFALGYMEGWADRYVAYQVKANKKYGWLHSTFDKIAPNPDLENKWMKKMDKVICVSEKCCEDFCSIMKNMKSKSITIENIVDTTFIRKQSQREDLADAEYSNLKNYQGFKIVSVCRLSIETKGLDRMILAAKKLVNEGYDFRWYIVGEGEDRQQVEEMILENNLSDYMVLTGRRINPYPFLAEADVMCMPSRWEGKPMVVVESMIIGTPCVVTNYLSAKEQIKNCDEGIVVENNDEAVFYGLKKCLDNRAWVKFTSEHLKNGEYGNKNYMRDIEKMLFDGF